MSKVKYFPVIVDWEDACGDGGWHDSDAIAHETATKVRTVGFVVRETKKHLILATGVAEDGQLLGYLVIPRPWVKRRLKVK